MPSFLSRGRLRSTILLEVSMLDRLLISAAVLAATAIPATARAQDPAKPAAEAQGTAKFTETEIQTIRDYFTTAKFEAKPLSADVMKSVARGKPLPTGVMKAQLPKDLATKLPTRPDYERAIVGDIVVLLDKTGNVVDILEGVIQR